MTEDITSISLPSEYDAALSIDNVFIDHEKNWFEAKIIASHQETPLYISEISGTFDRLIQVPILKRSLRAGDIIGNTDIDHIAVKSRSLNHDVLLDEQKVIGKTPRRIVHAGKPIKAQDVSLPQLVERGDIVTIIFSHGGVRLTARGKAMQNGAQGDIIRVVNTVSNRSLDALVSRYKEVRVTQF